MKDQDYVREIENAIGEAVDGTATVGVSVLLWALLLQARAGADKRVLQMDPASGMVSAVGTETPLPQSVYLPPWPKGTLLTANRGDVSGSWSVTVTTKARTITREGRVNGYTSPRASVEWAVFDAFGLTR